MLTVAVYIHIKPDDVEAFISATEVNARNSIDEEGILRFDFLQRQDEPNHFMLYEVYKESTDQLKHRESAHYLTWREQVESMLAEPRQGIKYTRIYPPDSDWE
ncbi:MAG: antibiotic biosynthesis monooxygenase [Anaerolineaceae bacterium]|nr:antibiotic biosynthesis monooxygenase [Anaerolineaceae bacterium]